MKLQLAQLPTSWPRIALGELVDFLDSRRKPIKATERVSGPYPYYGANGLQDHVDGYLFDEKLVLLAEDGGYFFDETRPIAYMVEGKCWVNNHAHVLRARQQIIPEFLNYQLGFADVKLFLSGSTRAKLTKGDAARIEIICPPLPEQRRIVDILSRAESIVRLRREAEKKAAELIPALFLDMFGDPATNPMGWPMVAFGDIGECRLGKMLDKQKQSGDFQLPYLRNVNVQWNRIDTYDLLTMDFHPDEREKFRLHTGDILICEGGEVGRAAIWNGLLEECYYQKALHRLRPNLEMVRPDFIVCLLWHLARTGALLGASTHATIAHLTGVQLKAMKIICPPIALQKQFGQQAERCKSIQVQQAAATAKAQATYDALLAQAFAN